MPALGREPCCAIELAPPHLAIAASRRVDGGDATDLYPDADGPLLAAALVDAGADARRISWDDEDVDWRRFALVVVNSTWDSVDLPEQFLAWVRRGAESTTVMNPLAAIEWNIDKTYLGLLESRGIPSWTRSGCPTARRGSHHRTSSS